MQQTQTQVQMHNRRFYNYVLKNENNEADIMLYGNIGEVVGYDDITDQEIVKQIDDAKEELFNLRFSQATGNLEHPARIKELRKLVARMKTILRERELNN